MLCLHVCFPVFLSVCLASTTSDSNNTLLHISLIRFPCCCRLLGISYSAVSFTSKVPWTKFPPLLQGWQVKVIKNIKDRPCLFVRQPPPSPPSPPVPPSEPVMTSSLSVCTAPFSLLDPFLPPPPFHVCFLLFHLLLLLLLLLCPFRPSPSPRRAPFRLFIYFIPRISSLPLPSLRVPGLPGLFTRQGLRLVLPLTAQQ